MGGYRLLAQSLSQMLRIGGRFPVEGNDDIPRFEHPVGSGVLHDFAHLDALWFADEERTGDRELEHFPDVGQGASLRRRRGAGTHQAGDERQQKGS